MNDNRRTFTFRTANLLVQPFWRQGVLCHDSFIKLLANTHEEANRKLKGYIEIGRRLGWYK